VWQCELFWCFFFHFCSLVFSISFHGPFISRGLIPKVPWSFSIRRFSNYTFCVSKSDISHIYYLYIDHQSIYRFTKTDVSRNLLPGSTTSRTFATTKSKAGSVWFCPAPRLRKTDDLTKQLAEIRATPELIEKEAWLLSNAQDSFDSCLINLSAPI